MKPVNIELDAEIVVGNHTYPFVLYVSGQHEHNRVYDMTATTVRSISEIIDADDFVPELLQESYESDLDNAYDKDKARRNDE